MANNGSEALTIDNTEITHISKNADSLSGIIMDCDVDSIYENMKRVITEPTLTELYRDKIKSVAIATPEERLQEIEALFQ